ncbi:MAG: family 65 glycosyl hydrolase domain-containing protein, partial [Bacteroidota bacterium]
MKQYIREDEWNIIEDGFDPHLNKISESIFSIGNGMMGQRANFEETYSGETLQGNYIAGIYYPDKTRVGWWKNGYPEYFAKILNAANWIGLEIRVGDEVLDLAKCKVSNFRRTLHMREGFLERSFEAELASGKKVRVNTQRFYSIKRDEIGAMRYKLTALNFSEKVTVTSFLDGDVKNEDSNYDEKFWEEESCELFDDTALLILRTRKSNFQVATAIKTRMVCDGIEPGEFTKVRRNKYAAHKTSIALKVGSSLIITKFAANLSSENHSPEKLAEYSLRMVKLAAETGFESLLKEQSDAWKIKWDQNDMVIEGDVSAQQAIRFNIFQLNQTYTGKDPRLNIGPKGFTGEKYGGLTYWDTEAYCVPFYLATAPQDVARNLLIYRYRHLQKAIENAVNLGFHDGAALYPMVTINGEECHNEWEITFEEIHRNGAIAYAIFNYVRYTGDKAYLGDYGLEVLVGISRFWAQRVNFSAVKAKYMILGVTGPNEYENNVNNNWYTNTIAAWCLKYTRQVAETVQTETPGKYAELAQRISLSDDELVQWFSIAENMYYPECPELGIFLQQDGYLDKEQVPVKDLDTGSRPLNQKWSWDRILRSCYIKQADVLQGLYFFEDDFDKETLQRNFDFYEARTVHESSLSPCIHSILASRLEDEKRAYEFYLRTARLDLDDYNNDTEDGLHITSMAGTWMSLTEGFAGMKVRNDILIFSPFLPEKWASFSFSLTFRNAALNVKVGRKAVSIINRSEKDVKVKVYDTEYHLAAGSTVQA